MWTNIEELQVKIKASKYLYRCAHCNKLAVQSRSNDRPLMSLGTWRCPETMKKAKVRRG